jgi:hypothetical protein
MGIAIRLGGGMGQRIARATALGALLLFGFADAGAKTERVRPYEIAGPVGLGSDERLCRRLATALNAEGRRELTAPRTDSMFARWREVQNPRSREIIHEATRADILNEGLARTVYRVTNLYAPYEALQSLLFMRDDSEPLPVESTGGPSVWAEAISNGRMIDPLRYLLLTPTAPLADFVSRYPPFSNAAGGRFIFGHRWDAVDVISTAEGRTMFLRQETKRRMAILVEIKNSHALPICYLA